MKRILQGLAILAASFTSIACNTANVASYRQNFPIQPNINNHPDTTKEPNTLRGTKSFQKTTEYTLLRTRLLNAWMPMCEMSEGFYPCIYRCSSNKPTVGIGTNMVGCSIPLSEMPLYTKSGKRLNTTEIRNWMNKTAGKNKTECRKLASTLGYRGISHTDAIRLAHEEAALKVDLVHEAMLAKHGMELFDQPLPIQVLILDLAYQRGHNGVFYNAALWNCLKNKDYANAHKYVVCCTNKNRNVVKKALTNLAHHCKQGTDISAQLSTLERFDIKFHPTDLNQSVFMVANIDYRSKRTASTQKTNQKKAKSTRKTTSKHSKYARHG